MTTDFSSDLGVLLGVVSLPFPFIGFIGSRTKIAPIFKQLQQASMSESVLSRLYGAV